MEEKRDQRRRKVLENRADRLARITQLNSQLTEEISYDSPVAESQGAIQKPIRDIPKASSCEIEKPATKSRDHPVLQERFVPPEPQLENITTPKPVKPRRDLIGWIHTIAFLLVSSISIANWLYTTSHLKLKATDPSLSDLLVQTCINLIGMTLQPVGHSLGPPQIIEFAGNIMPMWGAFFTLEVVLLSVRWMTNTNINRFSIPEAAAPIAAMLRINTSTIEAIVNSLRVYYDMYSFFMNDLYVIVFLMGSAICIAHLANSWGMC